MQQKEALKLFFSFVWAKQEKKRLIVAFILTISIIIADLLVPFMLKKGVELLSIPIKDQPFILSLILLSYALVWISSRVFSAIREMIAIKVLEETMRRVILKIFSHLHSLSPRFHYEHGKGGLVHEVVKRVENAFPTLFWDLCFFIIPSLIQGLISLFIVGWLYGFNFSFILLATFITFFVFTWKADQKTRFVYRKLHKAQQAVTSHVADSFLNFETVKFYNREKYEASRCNDVLLEKEEAKKQKVFRIERLRLTQGVILGIGLLVMTISSGIATSKGAFSPADFILLNGYLFQFIDPLVYFGRLFRNIDEALTDLEHTVELLKMEPEVQNDPAALKLQCSKGTVVFKHVFFGYQSERTILQDLSFEIPSGKTTAIVGPTGSGKSTIARLLFRFYDIQQGSILIDGQDISKVTQKSLRDCLGIVPQETLLFDQSLYANIAYAKPGATIEEVMKVIQIANLENLIEKLPQGIQTVVGPRGVKLSGGEKQRIAIARVLLKNPKIFIFDEATSALDMQTEREIQENLKSISKNHTTIVIAHRLSTIIDADKILVLKNGRLEEEGTHQELLESGGIYLELWKKHGSFPEVSFV